MFHRYRRGWILCFLALLALPLIGAVVLPGTLRSPFEFRPPAAAPAMPQRWEEWLTLPARAEPWLRDHVGFRRQMIRAHAWVAHGLLRTGNEAVLIGKHGQLFYRHDHAIEQSTGRLLRPAQIDETADVLRDVAAILAARGTRFIYGVAPNGSTIYRDHLPRWARGTGGVTEYDLMMAALRARGVAALDLRPALNAARALQRPYYRDDTHWSSLGALAGYNALVAAAGREAWQFDPTRIAAPDFVRVGGDLARMLGIAEDVVEPSRFLPLHTPPREHMPNRPPFPPADVMTSDRAEGPTILIIGDSFTQAEVAALTMQHARRVIWVHHAGCTFDWEPIERFRPDEVWWVPVERAMLCAPGQRPKGMPAR